MPGYTYTTMLPGGQYARGKGRFILVYRLAMDARPWRGMMVWLAENIQACLRIFRRTQHQWLARDILHPSQGVYSVYVLWPHRTNPSNPWQNRRIYPLAYCPPGRGFSLSYIPRALPPVTI